MAKSFRQFQCEPGFVFFSKHVLALSKMCMESSPTWKFNLQVNFMCFFQKKMNSFWSSIKLNHVQEMLHSTQPYPNALQPFFIGSCPDYPFFMSSDQYSYRYNYHGC